ncbi:hypothetical protein TWF106_002173 [Orbilia oligospora]|uniref:Phosphoglycerate mutase-like protein n=1 Tax=Orbilia oligospora TaxID=2813651 RepID=A0A7C8Q181_ORBOL|nr:hypothetical protein TWF788_001387 [Orbilia oligospora]KAF3219449.1 hypothetical protein TWF679_010918 [Orbilia oligospora]KAF3225657.1 hypothetical protein TWF106_002173 [Orbilia oligospora]
MKILFIRHGETTDNLRHVYAGVTDSSLTSHGVLQTARLASHIGSTIPPITHIFSSPLSRAKKTAEAIYEEQKRLRVSQSRNKHSPSTEKDQEGEERKGKDSTSDLPETAASSSKSINPILNEDEKTIGYDNGEEEEAGEAIYFKIDADLIEQDFGSYEGETFLTTTPKKNLKKRKRSDSVGSGIGSTSSPAGGSGGDTKKRRGDDSGPSTSGKTDVEMTAGEEGPLTGAIDTPLAATAVPLPEEEEEEGEEEEFREMETPASIKARADSFIHRCIIPLLPGTPILLPPSLAGASQNTTTTSNDQDPPPEGSSPVVAIVSHGMLLSWLWKSFVALFPPTSVLATTPVVQKGWYQGKHPGWGNTGYLVVEVLPKGVVSKDGMTVVIEGVNEKVHLVGLKRTGGGVGSEKWDQRQTKLEGFFGKKEG